MLTTCTLQSGSQNSATQFELFPEFEHKPANSAPVSPSIPPKRAETAPKGNKRGRPRKEVKKVGPGRKLTHSELLEEQVNYRGRKRQRRKMIQKIRSLTGHSKSPWVTFLVQLINNNHSGIGFNPYCSNYLTSVAGQHHFARITKKSVRQVKRYIRDAESAGILIRKHTVISRGRDAIKTIPCYTLALGLLSNELNEHSISELNVPAKKSIQDKELGNKMSPISKNLEDLNARRGNEQEKKFLSSEEKLKLSRKLYTKLNSKQQQMVRYSLSFIRQCPEPIRTHGDESHWSLFIVSNPEPVRDMLKAFERELATYTGNPPPARGALLGRLKHLRRSLRNQRKLTKQETAKAQEWDTGFANAERKAKEAVTKDVPHDPYGRKTTGFITFGDIMGHFDMNSIANSGE